MNKRWIMAAVLVTAMSIQTTGLMAMDTQIVIQEGTENNMISEQEDARSMYSTKTGEITRISKEDNTFEILVGGEMDGIRFLLQPDNIIMNVETLEMLHQDDLKEGMNVTVVIDKNVPMTMSLPAICSGQTAVLVNASDKNVEVAYFDETLTNEANTLALNISDSTVIQNSRGERRIFTAEDIKNQDAIVIYTSSTRSIPAQTTPEYVMILCRDEEDAEQQEESAVNTRNLEDKTASSYIPVREAAEKLGYEVKWEASQKTVCLSKDGNEITLKVGERSFSYNKEEIALEESIKLEGNKVYVPESLLTTLK